MPIYFFQEDTDFKLKKSRKISQWISSVAAREGRSINTINYIFCSDRYLLQLNQDYLNHTTLTDIITFDLGDSGAAITGDIFISIDRVKENAAELNLPLEQELLRVVVHGILHLVGYADKTPREKEGMRKKEDAYLSLFFNQRFT